MCTQNDDANASVCAATSIAIYKISRESFVRENVKCNRMRARSRSKAMWFNSVSLGQFEVAGWGGCGGCGDGWASLLLPTP